MGQKCPCYTNKSTEENTFFNYTNDQDTFKNKQYEEYLAKSKFNNMTTNVPDEGYDTNYMFEDLSIEKIKLLQSLIRKHLFKKNIKHTLVQESTQIYEEFRSLFTSNNLQRAEEKYQKLHYKDNLIEPCFLVQTKIIISKDRSSFYSGELNINSEKHGKGFLLKENGSKYEGIWKEDQLIYGRYIDSDGSMSEGFFMNNKLTGLGSFLTLGSYSYEGNFIENEKSGIGKEETFDYSYEGEFKNNYKNGHGKQIFKNLGDIFVGEFKEDKISGNGCYLFKNGEKYNGSFEDGMMHGFGTYTWPDGSEYTGDYINNIKHGNGVFRMNNGKVYEGPFFEGKPHGNGKLTNTKGVIAVVEFVNGKIMKKKDLNRKNLNQ
jgi:hypothetical protein